MEATGLSPRQNKIYTLKSFLLAAIEAPGILEKKITSKELATLIIQIMNKKGSEDEDDRFVQALEVLKEGQLPSGFTIEEMAMLNRMYLDYERGQQIKQKRLEKLGELLPKKKTAETLIAVIQQTRNFFGASLWRRFRDTGGDYELIKSACHQADKEITNYVTDKVNKL